MPELQIQPFSEEHVEGAASLLEERHNRQRAVEPSLRAGLDYRGEIEALWALDERSGAAATRDGELVGYLLGSHRAGGGWGIEDEFGATGQCAGSPPHDGQAEGKVVKHFYGKARFVKLARR